LRRTERMVVPRYCSKAKLLFYLTYKMGSILRISTL
jgi:hypothetical protein